MRATTLTLCLEGNTNRSSSIILHQSSILHPPPSIFNPPPSIFPFYFLHLYQFNDNFVAMMKKLLVSLLSALLCISVAAEPEIQPDENQNMNNITIDENGNVFVSPLKYHISSDTTAEVIYDESYKELKSVVIPSKIQIDIFSYPLTSIGELSIKIPSSVTSIGDGAFRDCSGLTSIEIPSSVTSIGNNAFWGCSGLTSIKIPSSVTSIENEAFWNCHSLTSIDIPSSLTSIENDVFWNCCGLTSIRIPSSVISIGNYAFSDCRALTSIKIPSSVTNIGVFAFKNCKNLDVIIDNSEKNISVGDYAFDDCKSVKFLK
jgi:hypothetical protein